MILARCPACSTTFRVRPEQLRARQGRVRCGQCQHAFNALETLVEESPLLAETPGLAPSGTDPHLFVLEEKARGAPATRPPDADAAPAAEPKGESPDLPSSSEPAFAASPAAIEDVAATLFPDGPWRQEPSGRIEAEAIEEWPPMDDGPPDEPAAAAPPSSGSAPPAAVDFDALIHTRDHAEAPAAPALNPVPWPKPLPEFPHPVASPEADELPDETDDEAAPPSGDAESASPDLKQAAWAAAATLLLLAFLAQGMLVFRDEIAQSSPPMRPFLAGLCAGLGCELALPRDPAEIAIESSDIQPDAAREAFFTLHATLRNRADFPQAWPYLEITLTDARDKALVRRVLEPAQWLPGNAPKDAFPAKREVVTRVSFEAPGVAAAGYRVYAFYP